MTRKIKLKDLQEIYLNNFNSPDYHPNPTINAAYKIGARDFMATIEDYICLEEELVWESKPIPVEESL